MRVVGKEPRALMGLSNDNEMFEGLRHIEMLSSHPYDKSLTARWIEVLITITSSEVQKLSSTIEWIILRIKHL